MGGGLSKLAAIDFGIQWVLWIFAWLLKTEKFYDLAGSSTFIILTYLSLQWQKKEGLHTRQKINSAMVFIWALRLGLFLFSRILRDGSDRRFDKAKNNPAHFFLFWTVQGIWVFLTLLPVLLNNQQSRNVPIQSRDRLGWILWTVGFLCEVIADHQKSVFRADPNNKEKFIRSGLWSVSRHPNYLGEIMLWSGIWLSASVPLRGARRWLSLLSPLLVTVLLTKVSGIPLLEASGLKRYGADPDYRQYVKDTAVLVPFLW